MARRLFDPVRPPTERPPGSIGNVSLKTLTGSWKPCREIEAGERPDWSYARLTWQDAVDAGVISMSVIDDARRSLPGPVFEALYEARQPSEGMGLFQHLTADRRRGGRRRPVVASGARLGIWPGERHYPQ